MGVMIFMEKLKMNINKKDDHRYLDDKDKFLKLSFDVLDKYFPEGYEQFLDFYIRIDSDQNKNKFLKIASFYKYLVVDGRFMNVARLRATMLPVQLWGILGDKSILSD